MALSVGKDGGVSEFNAANTEADKEEADVIAQTCLERYSRLSGGAKPVVRNDGTYEWTVLAGVVLKECVNGKCEYRCIALATGVKAQPLSSLSPHGDIVHDCHAEVLARRAARRWLLHRLLLEVRSDTDASPGPSRAVFQMQPSSRFHFAEGVSVHLYCSTLPCGDISSAHLLGTRQTLQGEGKEEGEEEEDSCTQETIVRGRSQLSVPGVRLRTKPGRPQAPVSISMSCSDKVMLWSMLGMQGALLSRWIEPIFFTSYVIGTEALEHVCRKKHRIWDEQQSCEAQLQFHTILSQKVQAARSQVSAQHHIPFILMTRLPFTDSREQCESRLLEKRPHAVVSGPSDDQDITPAMGSIVSILGEKPHSILEGRKQGASARRRPDGTLPRSSRSPLCKLEWLSFVASIAPVMDPIVHGQHFALTGSYNTIKSQETHGQWTPYTLRKWQARGYQHPTDALWALEDRRVDEFVQRHDNHPEHPEPAPKQAPTPKQTPAIDQQHTTKHVQYGPWLLQDAHQQHALQSFTNSEQSGAAPPLHGWLVAPRWTRSFAVDGTLL